jgi:hypothetical protein
MQEQAVETIRQTQQVFAGVLRANFDFAERLLKAQRELAEGVISATTPKTPTHER